MIGLPFLRKKTNNLSPYVLIVLDGFGIAPPSKGNAISEANTPNLDSYKTNFLYTELIAAGESVGLPANEAGNSEVGHLTLGAGRVVYQSLPRIDMAIEDKSFFDNRAFASCADHIKKYSSNLHMMGLIGSGTVHSSTEHLYALLKFCRKNGLKNVHLHLFTDGRDSPPTDGIKVVKDIQDRLSDLYSFAKISTICGRYYAMDRDGNWDRTKEAYDLIVEAKGRREERALDAIQRSYDSGKTDEFIEPVVVGDYQGVRDNDGIIFFNFRIDRPRQLTMAFVFDNFESLKSIEFGYVPHETKKQLKVTEGPTFKREKRPANMFFVTMTQYQKNLPVSAIAFPPLTVSDSLPEILSKKGLKQLHLAESEKERMVTYYFNGLREEKFQGEDDVIVASPSVATYDKKPEMSAAKIVNSFTKMVVRDTYNFFVINFANPDMVAHSGKLSAAIRAVETVDKSVASIVDEVLKRHGVIFITADHGNAEELLTLPSKTFFYTTKKGSVNTEHSNNPVPLYIIGENYKKGTKVPKGTLSDVAPTILSCMGIVKTPDMTGRNLLETKPQQITQINTHGDIKPVI